MLNSKRCMKIILITIFIYFQLVKIKMVVDEYCSVGKINYFWDYLGKEIFYKQLNGFKCDIKNSDFSIDSDRFKMIKKEIVKHSRQEKYKHVEFNWVSNEKKTSFTHKKFQLICSNSVI